MGDYHQQHSPILLSEEEGGREGVTGAPHLHAYYAAYFSAPSCRKEEAHGGVATRARQTIVTYRAVGGETTLISPSISRS